MTESAAQPAPEPETAAAAAPQENDPAARITALEEQVIALKEQGLRYLAEAENTRRRAQKEREDTAKYAITGFAADLLAVADNFERALAAKLPDGLPDAVKSLLTGIDATGRQLAAALERAGIKKIDADGQLFDPHFHRVVQEIDDASKPAGTIMQVLQPGYIIHDRLLREAMVTVSKGGPAPNKVDKSA
ncbi:MAG: nucleotide exchange factor GrpE [Alphaproteobacteria bacterium]